MTVQPIRKSKVTGRGIRKRIRREQWRLARFIGGVLWQRHIRRQKWPDSPEQGQ